MFLDPGIVGAVVQPEGAHEGFKLRTQQDCGGRIEREELYEEVWSVPIVKLAEKYGLSDKGLRKVCKRLNVPVPERVSAEFVALEEWALGVARGVDPLGRRVATSAGGV